MNLISAHHVKESMGQGFGSLEYGFSGMRRFAVVLVAVRNIIFRAYVLNR